MSSLYVFCYSYLYEFIDVYTFNESKLELPSKVHLLQHSMRDLVFYFTKFQKVLSFTFY